MVDGHLWQGPNRQQRFSMRDFELERSHSTQFISPAEGNAWSNAHSIESGSRPKPRPVFRRPQEPPATPQDTSTDDELNRPLGEIIARKPSKTKAGAGQKKRTAAQAMLEDEPTPTKANGTSTVTHRGGAAGRKAFTVPEIVLLNQCVDVIGFAGGDMWSKVVEKFNHNRQSEWPERSLNSLKKKFMEMVNSKPRTGEAVIPNHVKHAKDIYMTKLGSLEEPNAGASEDEDIDTIEFDPGNVSPTPASPASGRHSKRSKETLKSQHPQTSSRTSSRADQREMISDFFSGRTREERDRIKFQQQSQLTSLAHEFESGRMKDQQISALLEKLDKRRDELHEARLEILRLQQALNLRDLSMKDPKVLENLVHASNNLGLPLPPVHQDFDRHSSAKRVRLYPSFLKQESVSPAPPSLLSVKHETYSPPHFTNRCQLQRSPLPTHVKHESPPGVVTMYNSEVIEILDSDDNESTCSVPGFDSTNLRPQQTNKAPTGTLAPFGDRNWELEAGSSKGKENANPVNEHLGGNKLPMPYSSPNLQTLTQFPPVQLPPTWLPPIQNLVPFVPEAGPSTAQNSWAPFPVLHAPQPTLGPTLVPTAIEPTNRLPGIDQFLRRPPRL